MNPFVVQFCKAQVTQRKDKPKEIQGQEIPAKRMSPYLYYPLCHASWIWLHTANIYNLGIASKQWLAIKQGASRIFTTLSLCRLLDRFWIPHWGMAIKQGALLISKIFTISGFVDSIYLWPAVENRMHLGTSKIFTTLSLCRLLDRRHLGNTNLKQHSFAITAISLYAVASHKDKQVRLYCAGNSISLL